MDVSRARNGRVFDLLAQPFRILGVNPTAGNKQIEDAFSIAQQTRVASAEALSFARDALLDPARRLSYELCYPLDCPALEIEAFYAALSGDASTSELVQFAVRLGPLARANFAAHIASHRSADEALLYALLESHASIDAYEIYARLRAARTAAGIPAPSLISTDQALQELRNTHAAAVFAGYDPIQVAAVPVLECTKQILGHRERRHIEALDNILAPYRKAIDPLQKDAAKQIESACMALQQRPGDPSLVEELSTAVQVWTSLCHPLLLWDAEHNRRELDYEAPIDQLRVLIATLTENKHYEVASKIADLTRDVFSAVPTTIDRLAEDAGLMMLHQNIKHLKDAIVGLENNPGPLVAALEKDGFGPKSTGPANKLWEAFLSVVRSTSSTPSSELPWRLVGDFAKGLGKKPRAAAAVTRLITGLIQYGNGVSAAPEILNALGDNLRAVRKKKLRRRMALAGLALFASAALCICAFYLGFDQVRLLWSNASFGAHTQHSAPALVAEMMPPVGTGQHLDLEGVRYCHFQEERLRVIKEEVRGAEDAREFNLLVVDYNSRCSDFFYRDNDLKTVLAEVSANRNLLEADAKRIISAWPGHTP
jgi:hypothetical protein